GIVAPGAAPAAAGVEPGDDLVEEALHVRIGHDGAQQAAGPRAAEGAETLHENDAGAGAGGGERGADSAGTATEDEHLGVVEKFEFAGGLAKQDGGGVKGLHGGRGERRTRRRGGGASAGRTTWNRRRPLSGGRGGGRSRSRG